MNNQIQELDVSITEAEEKIRVAEAVGKLMNNKEFKSIVLNGYFIEEASALVLCKAYPHNGDDVSQRNINKAIDAVGGFRFYLENLVQQGKAAVSAKHELEAEIEAIESGE